MKTETIIAVLLVASLLLFFGCTQEQTNNGQSNTIDTNESIDTNVTADSQTIENDITSNWINESEVVDTGSML